MAKPTPRFYLFHGSDMFRMKQAVDKMRRDMAAVDSAGMNLSDVDGTQVRAAEVIAQVSVMPFLADRRVVIVHDLLTWNTRKGAGEKGKQQIETLLEELPYLPEYARLVMVESKKIAENLKIVKLVKSDPNGFDKLFEPPKDLSRWLMTRAKNEYNTVLEPMAAAALASVLGDDLQRADNELLKLASYANGAAITEEMVTLLTPYTSETKVFALTDHIAARRGKEAISTLHALLDDQEENPFKLWGLMISQFRRMLLVKEQLVLGKNKHPKSIAEAIGAKYIPDTMIGQVRNMSLANLELIYRRLLEYDTDIKTGKIDIVTAFDLIIGRLTR